eukprot:709595_1
MHIYDIERVVLTFCIKFLEISILVLFPMILTKHASTTEIPGCGHSIELFLGVIEALCDPCTGPHVKSNRLHRFLLQIAFRSKITFFLKFLTFYHFLHIRSIGES